ncbi:MAG: CPBP family intramembrane metalloprotease [Prolixibacteraceae bacterium]|nr:CPBP family intramembrane metalloprotease [Prolixibacteraceae bacterium]
MNSFSNHSELFNFTVAITVSLFGFLFYYFLSESGIIEKWLNSRKGEVFDVLFRRLLGVLLYGCLPLSILLLFRTNDLAIYGFNAPRPETYLWTLLLSIIILPLNYYNSLRTDNQKIYPQIRTTYWSFSLLTMSAASWMGYLLAYEFLFRGFLFFSSIPLMGLWPSILLNTLIYALVHIPKGYKETLGAIPFGILLCYLTYKTNSIWVAVFAHIIMALSSEWFSIRAHPQMLVKRI